MGPTCMISMFPATVKHPDRLLYRDAITPSPILRTVCPPGKLVILPNNVTMDKGRYKGTHWEQFEKVLQKM